MFIYWDADKSGEMSAQELGCCMNSLGVRMSKEQLDEVVLYYDSGKGMSEMNYNELLSDISNGEPTITQFVENRHLTNSDIDVRFVEEADLKVKLTKPVEQFIEATRNWVLTRMRVEGGTPFYHIRNLFQFYDYDHSNGLNAKELSVATRKGMKLTITMEQAEEIVRYYDVRREGQMYYSDFLKDVAAGTKPVLHFTDITHEERQRQIRSLSVNPYLPRPFQAPANKTLENFKQNVKLALHAKVRSIGGTVTAWLKEAFIAWDPKFTKTITDWRMLQGAARSLNVKINEEEAKSIMRSYDKWDNGEMHYMLLLRDMNDEDSNFLMDARPADELAQTATSRTPSSVESNLRRFKKAVEAYARKSSGVLEPKVLLHGTLLRFDKQKAGRLDAEGLSGVARELGVDLTAQEVQSIVLWFDTNGSRMLDYNAFTQQLFGLSEGQAQEDFLTKSLSLPRLNSLAGSSSFDLKNTYSRNGQHIGLAQDTSNIRKSSDSLGRMAAGGGAAAVAMMKKPMTSPGKLGGRPRPKIGRSDEKKLTGKEATTSSKETADLLFGDNKYGRIGSQGTTYSTSYAADEDKSGAEKERMTKNMTLVENVNDKKLRLEQKKAIVLSEREACEQNLKSIEEQRSQLLADYKARKKQERGSKEKKVFGYKADLP